MRTEQLYYLITVARCGSMNKASKELFLTQPALSAAISSLEKEIGTALIKRSKSGVTLTNIGKRVYDDALNILDNVNNWSHLNDDSITLNDTIAISAFETVSYLILPEVMVNLHHNYPSLRIVMDNYISDPALFYDDQFDFVITPSINNERFPVNARYQQEIIFRDYYVAYLSSTNPLAQKEAVTMKDLAKNDFVFVPDSRFLSHAPDNFVNPDHFLFLHQKNGIMANVAKDNAVTIFPSMRKYHNYYIHTGAIVARPILDNCVSYDHLLIYPAEYRMTSSQQIFLKYLRQSYEAFHAYTLAERKSLFDSIGIFIS